MIPTLADLPKELHELDASPGEIHIPYRWYRQLLDYAQELMETKEEENKDI